MLKLINITKEYVIDNSDKTLALNDVSIQFRKNEFVAILGPSGCGKTTLLNIVGGLDRYTSGDIQIDGISTKQYDDIDWDTYRNRRIGFVFQSYNLIPHMNILKNVALCLTLSGVEKEERYQRAREALRKVGLESQAKKKPNQLSGGQMQRVAIARALVNNPDIILADEPTGALDTESGIQIMDLLKEVAEDRLVVMVTHNPQLAEEYSTRIVYLKDGEVVGDTMPYNPETEDAAKVEENIVPVDDEIVADENAAADENVETENVNADVEKDEELKGNAITKKVKTMSKAMVKRLKRKEQKKSSMKLHTAIELSWNNLISKKGRTLLTSIAGSIGIIGIILVLALSTGAKMYINSIEENALSSYPLTINKSNADMGAILSILTQGKSDREENPKSDIIYTQSVLGEVMKNITSLISENDLYELKQYIDKNFDSSLATVHYNYGTTFNAYTLEGDKTDKYMKVNPYTEVMFSVLDDLPQWIKDMKISGMSVTDALGTFGTILGDCWSEMSENQNLLNQQYELVGNSKWPTKEDEIVIVVDNKNQLIDYQLFMLGLKSPDDVMTALAGGEFAQSAVYDTDELIGREYKILTNAAYFDKVGDDFVYGDKTNEDMDFIDGRIAAGQGINCKVVGVIRPKEGVNVTSINGVIGYTKALGEKLINIAESNAAIKALEKAYDDAYDAFERGENPKQEYISPITYAYSVDGGQTTKNLVAGVSKIPFADHQELLRALGVVDLDYPISIDFYCSSFEAKEQVVDFINKYNEETGNDVKYSDNLSIIMDFV
ncbi:MAG: ABC transporter ATP-binding protein, partial [Clostridia bacterium]|nr:ABC transporter ATP-binding protein [Clostridia bacterium]